MRGPALLARPLESGVAPLTASLLARGLHTRIARGAFALSERLSGNALKLVRDASKYNETAYEAGRCPWMGCVKKSM